MGVPEIYSIGHSRHSIEHFLELLSQNNIACLVDVRSRPQSRFSPHFNRRALSDCLLKAGIEYVFLGDQLGGRPKDPECLDEDGNVNYERVAQMDWYEEGLDRLLEIGKGTRTVMMCSEEHPDQCHRKFLITRSLLDEGRAIVHHIRGDGSLERGDEASG